MQRRGTITAAGAIYVGAMFDQRLHRRWTTKPNRMMQCRHAVLVRGMDIGAGLKQLHESLLLVCGIGVSLATDIGKFVVHYGCPVQYNRLLGWIGERVPPFRKFL